MSTTMRVAVNERPEVGLQEGHIHKRIVDDKLRYEVFGDIFSKLDKMEALADKLRVAMSIAKESNVSCDSLVNCVMSGYELNIKHSKHSNVQIPVYSGYHEEISPFDFILELEKYQYAVSYSEYKMLSRVLPLAFLGDALLWYRKMSEHLKT